MGDKNERREEKKKRGEKKGALCAYEWRASDAVEVVEQALGVVDGGAEHGAGPAPLAVQVLPVERTAVPGEREGEGGREGGRERERERGR